MRKRVTMAIDADVLQYLEWQVALTGSTVPARANALLRMTMSQELTRPDVARTFTAYKEQRERLAGMVPLDTPVGS